LRHYFGGAALEPLFATIGVLALIVAWGGWRLRLWAYRVSFVLQAWSSLWCLPDRLVDRGEVRPDRLATPRRRVRRLQPGWLLQSATRAAFSPQSGSAQSEPPKVPTAEEEKELHRLNTHLAVVAGVHG
jgi:hypothetical protein